MLSGPDESDRSNRRFASVLSGPDVLSSGSSGGLSDAREGRAFGPIAPKKKLHPAKLDHLRISIKIRLPLRPPLRGLRGLRGGRIIFLKKVIKKMDKNTKA